MPGTTLTIRPGPPQQLTGAPYDSEVVFYNQDTTNAVWLGPNQAVAPNLGQRLPPYGYIVWDNKSQPPWACVDTGVVSNVLVTASDDVNDVSDPVGVALAVAANGIPSVLVMTTIVNGDTIAGGASKSYDVSKYASLVIKITVNRANPTSQNYGVQFRQGPTDTDAVNQPTSSEILAPAPGTASGSWSASVVLPVNGARLYVTDNDPDAVNSLVTLTVVGSNRMINRPYLNNRFTGQGNRTSVTSNFPTGDTLVTTTGQTVSGPVKLYVSVTDTHSEFTCRVRVADGSGNTYDNYLFSSDDLDVLNGIRIGVIDAVMPLPIYFYVLNFDIPPGVSITVIIHAMSSV